MFIRDCSQLSQDFSPVGEGLSYSKCKIFSVSIVKRYLVCQLSRGMYISPFRVNTNVTWFNLCAYNVHAKKNQKYIRTRRCTWSHPSILYHYNYQIKNIPILEPEFVDFVDLEPLVCEPFLEP